MNARFVTPAAAVAAAVLVAVPSSGVTAQQLPEGSKSIFVSALDDVGKPVKDMTADEFRLREDGTDREIVAVRPAQPPLQVVVLVDTSDSAVRLVQDIRNAVGAFIKQLHAVRNDAAIELMEFGQAPIPGTPFITSDQDLMAALNKMVGKPTADAVLIEALVQANKDLEKRPSSRRAIVSLNVEPSNEMSQDPNRVRDAFRKSDAQLWSLSFQSRDITMSTATTIPNGYVDGTRTLAPVPTNAGNTSAAANAANLTASRNAMLTDFAKATGGYRDIIDAQSAMERVLQQWADDLTYQYEIVYRRPGKTAKIVQVGTTRPGVHLHASGFAPQ